MGLLRLALLGVPAVEHDGRRVALPTRRALALLAYLAVEPGRHSREKIAALLWPESEPEPARANLRYTVAALRAALDRADQRPHCLADRLTLAFDRSAPFDLDTEALAAAASESDPAPGLERLAGAAALCRGEFLEGVGLRDAPELDEWIGLQRALWQRQAGRLLDRLSRRQAEEGALAAALATADRWLRLDRLNEGAHRRRLELHLAEGDGAAALRAYDECRELLGRELGVAPGAEIEGLAERARSARPAAAAPRPAATGRPGAASFETPLVGRTDELARAVELYHLARQGRPQLLALVGEPGIGKTRLADELLARARGQGADVLRGRAFETGGRLPYQPLLDALRPRLERENAPDDLVGDVWLAELSRVLPELRERYPDLPPTRGDEVVARTRLFEALARLGQALAARAPLVLFVDDAHWADAASLDVLHYLARRWAESGTPALLILGLRAEALASTPALGEFLLGLRRDLALTRLELGPLSQGATLDLLRGLFGPDGAAGPTVDRLGGWLFAETGGQPFFVAETLRSLLERGTLTSVEQPAGGWAIAARPDALAELASRPYLSPEVQDVIRVRLARLGPAARELLAAAAVLGQRFDFARLCRVADLAEREALPALDEVLRAHLLRELPPDGPADDASYGFWHDRLRDVTYQEAGEARRRVFHRRALATLGPEAAAGLAHHALAAGLSEEALAHSRSAGDQAMRVLAARDAIGHYSTAIALAERLERAEAVTDLRARRARAYASVALWGDARRELEATLAALPPEQDVRRAELLLQLSAAQFWMLDIPGVRRSAEEGLARVGSAGRPDLEMPLRGWLGSAEAADGRLEASIEQYGRSVAQAAELGVAPPAHVLTLHALMLYWLGRIDEASERSRAGVESAREANDASILMYSLPHLGLALAARGRYDQAQQLFDEARRFGREYAIQTLLARAIAMSAGYRLDLFDFDGHEALALEARELAFSSGFAPLAASAGIDLLFNYARRGDVGRAETLVDEVAGAVEKAAGFHGWLWRLRLAQARAEIALARGAWDDALAWSERAIEQSSATDRPKYRAAGLAARARALARLGRRDDARRSAAAAVALARRLEDPALLVRLAGSALEVDADAPLAAEAAAAAEAIARGLADPALRRAFEGGEAARALAGRGR